MISRWLPEGEELLCYIDNSEKKRGYRICDIPVCSIEEALEKELELIWIAILNQEAVSSVKRQLKESAYTGRIMDIQEFRKRQDIRLAALRLIADEIKSREIPGEIAELGVYQGVFSAEMNRLLPEKKLYLFDTFEGFDRRDLEIELLQNGNRGYKSMENDFSDTSIELVRNKLPYPEQAVFCPGHFPESLKENTDNVVRLPEMAFVNLDPDLYEPVYQGLCIFYPLLNPGGMILIHDYNSTQFPGVKKAVQRYCKEKGLYVVPLMDLHGSAILLKQG